MIDGELVCCGSNYTFHVCMHSRVLIAVVLQGRVVKDYGCLWHGPCLSAVERFTSLGNSQSSHTRAHGVFMLQAAPANVHSTSATAGGLLGPMSAEMASASGPPILNGDDGCTPAKRGAPSL